MADFGIATGTIGVISLGIQVCQGLLQYYGTWKDGRKDISRIYGLIGNLSEILKALKETMGNRSLNGELAINVDSSIAACTSSISELQEELTELEEIKGPGIRSKLHEQGRRLLYPFRESTLIKLKEIVSDIRENLSLAVGALNLEAAIKSGEQTNILVGRIDQMGLGVTKVEDGIALLSESIISNQKNQETNAILDWLSPLDFFAKQSDVSGRRQEGTGEWFFETLEYQAWLSGKEKSLWCYGLPGAGKTIMASAIIDRLEAQFSQASNIGLAFIYCNYKEQETQTLANFLGSLIKQLIRQSSVISEEILELYRVCAPRKTRPSHAQYCKMLLSNTAHFSRLYVVIDALDECNYTDGMRRNFIKELQNLGPQFQLLCTSRLLGDIEHAFETSPRLEIHAMDSDVKVYLEEQILQDSSLATFCAKDPLLQRTIIEKLIQNAKEMFLVAQLQFRSLTMKNTLKQVRKTLMRLPKELDKIYEEALARILAQHKDRSTMAIRMLAWITYARRPLTVEEIQHAIAVMDLDPDENCLDSDGEDLPSMEQLITVCEGLVAIDRKSNLIRLVHYTTQEYFESYRAQIFPNAQADISLGCLRYLSMDPFLLGPCTSDEDMLERLSRYKLLNYASRNWDHHTRGLPEIVNMEALLAFLNNRQVLSSMVQARTMRPHKYHLPLYSQLYAKNCPGIPLAAKFGLATLVGAMIKSGHDINGTGDDLMTGLHWAIREGYETTVAVLLKTGADVEAKDRMGLPPIHIAASRGRGAIIKLLLAAGANVNSKDSHGSTPLIKAAWKEKFEATKILLESGASVTDRDNSGFTALLASVSGREYAISKALLDAGADVNARDNKGHTALCKAIIGGGEDLVELLLKAGADCDMKGSFRRRTESSLCEACVNGNYATVKMLIAKMANVSAAMTWDGPTALHAACEENNEGMVTLLIDGGTDVTRKDWEGNTDLIAARKELASVLKQLLEAQFDVNDTNTFDRITQDYALACMELEFVELSL